jgi:hypothetical protein
MRAFERWSLEKISFPNKWSAIARILHIATFFNNTRHTSTCVLFSTSYIMTFMCSFSVYCGGSVICSLGSFITGAVIYCYGFQADEWLCKFLSVFFLFFFCHNKFCCLKNVKTINPTLDEEPIGTNCRYYTVGSKIKKKSRGP